MKKSFALLSLSLLALPLAACGSSDGQAATASKGDQFCTLAQSARDDEQALENVDPTDATALKLTYSTAIDSVSAMAAKAPKDISATVDKLLADEEELEGLLKDNDYDFAKFQASDEGKAILEKNTISENGKKLDTYLSDKCGIDITDDTVATADTIAVADTVPASDDTVPASDDSVGSTDTIVDLGEGEDAINQFLDFYELGTGANLTDDDRSCIVSNLVDAGVTGADLNQAIAGSPSQETQLALGQAFIDCKVEVQT